MLELDTVTINGDSHAKSWISQLMVTLQLP